MIKEAAHDLNRVRQILQVMVRHGFGNLLDRARVFERLGLGRPETEEDRSHAPAQRLTQMLTELRPTFIKIGQLLSTRPDLLDVVYTDALRTLQDQVAPFPFLEVQKILRRNLGEDPRNLFACIDPQPIASASIAQVHSAKTKNGLNVVIKVRRPGIERIVRSDLDILYSLTSLFEAVMENDELYNPVQVVREFDVALGYEMDFEREAESLRTFGRNFEKRTSLVIPKPVEGLCGTEVLTMCFLEGLRVEEVETGSELAQKAALNLVEGFYEQAFEDGLFHSDPHPGNLRILPDGRVGLLDFGQVGKLTPAMRNAMVLLGLGILLKDADTVSRLVYRFGSSSGRVDMEQLKQDIQETMEDSLKKKLNHIDTGKMLRQLLELSLRHRVRIPPEYTLAAKALATVEGTLRALFPELQPSTVAAPYIKRLLNERYNLDDMRGGLLRTMLQLSDFLTDVPQQISKILVDLESGRLSVSVLNPAEGELRRTIRSAGRDVFWGIIAAGLLIACLPSLAQPGPAPRAALYGVTTAGLIALGVMLRSYLSPFFRKFQIRAWLERRWGTQR